MDLTLLSKEELRAAAGVSNNSQDATLARLGKFVAATIATGCRLPPDGIIPPTLRQETCADTFRSSYSRLRRHWNGCERTLYLSRRPVVAVTSVIENGVTLTETTDYLINKSAGSITRMSGDCERSWAYGTIAAAYTAGWETVPDDLKYAATRFIQLMIAQADDPLLKRQNIPGVLDQEWWIDQTRQIGVPPEVLDILDRGGYVNEFAG